MSGSTQEVEVKLRFESASEARARLARLGAQLRQPRRFEDNIVFDREVQPLREAGKLLRLRRTGDLALLTVKAQVEGTHRHKVRDEDETAVGNFESMTEMLHQLGFTPCYRYQKYRSVFEFGDLAICLDETPLGCFVELEGPPEEIDRVADLLGFRQDQYICESYRGLHENAIEIGECAEGDLLLPPAEADPS